MPPHMSSGAGSAGNRTGLWASQYRDRNSTAFYPRP